MPKWNGGVIGVANNPTQSSAKGIWSLSEATKAIRAGLWPPSNAGADPYFENVTLLLPGDGTNGAQNNTFLDSSTNNFTITRNGNTTQGTFTPFSKAPGYWSTYFGGSSSSYVSAPYNASQFAFSTNSFTMEFFVYFNGFVNDGKFLIQYDGSSYWQLNYSTSNGIAFINNGTSIATQGSTTGWVVGTWYHVALVRNSSSFYIYRDGVVVASGTSSASINNNSSALTIAGNPNAGGASLNGFMSNVRVLNGTAAYSGTSTTAANFTVPTSPLTTTSGGASNCVLLTLQNNRFVDNSSFGSALTTGNSPAINPFSPFPTLTAYAAGTNGGSGYFDGTGDQLVTPSNAALGMSTGDFTIELWYYQLSRGSGHTLLAPSTDNLNIYITTGGVLGYYNGATQDSSQTIPLNAWGHIAVVRSSGTLKIYYNGVQVLSQANSINYGTASWYIGTNPAGIGASFGYITDARIVKGTAVYTAAFTPPTAPLTAITNTSLLLSGTNGGIIDTSMFNDLETVGNAQISTTQSKFGGSSMYFDGTGDYLLLQGGQNFTFGTGDFTIEMWVYVNSGLNTDIVYYDGRPASTNGLYNIIYTNSTGKLVYSTNSADRITGTTTLSTGTWYHVALSRSGTSTRLFLNGTQESSTYTDSNSYIVGANRPVIGANGFGLGNAPLNGYIDDLRITKGYARYTANFTAPVGPFNGFGD